MFQLILPFQLDLPFEADAGPFARGGGGAAKSGPRVPRRARRAGRESARNNLAFAFTLAHMTLDEQ